MCRDIAARNELAKTVNFEIYPVVNSEGFEYAKTVDRSWTNNRNTNNCNTGINLERNFNWFFDRNKNCGDADFGGLDYESETEIRLISFSTKPEMKFSLDH